MFVNYTIYINYKALKIITKKKLSITTKKTISPFQKKKKKKNSQGNDLPRKIPGGFIRVPKNINGSSAKISIGKSIFVLFFSIWQTVFLTEKNGR